MGNTFLSSERQAMILNSLLYIYTFRKTKVIPLGGRSVSTKMKLWAILFAIFHIGVVWLLLKIANLFVDLKRLSELNGYSMTPEEERFSFYLHSSMMLIVTSLFLIYIVRFKKKRNASNLVVLFLAIFATALYGWSVFEIYDCTINGDELHKLP